jgi:4'-phosphopantetheinyl transferase EntD
LKVSNPELSPALQALFPMRVAAAELRAPADPSLLYPEERLEVVNAVSSRVEEFTSGRLCARKALAQFGMENFPLRVGSQRQPLWPATLTGSITHTTGYCAAVVAKRTDCIGIGIDIETIESVERSVWPKICTADERRKVQSLDDVYQQKAVALTFSAKEAFYKIQNPQVQ